jgi:hypothetical protein
MLVISEYIFISLVWLVIVIIRVLNLEARIPAINLTYVCVCVCVCVRVCVRHSVELSFISDT